MIHEDLEAIPKCLCACVTGATGGVGKRVVEVLLQHGKAVRAVVRDEEKGRHMLVLM